GGCGGSVRGSGSRVARRKRTIREQDTPRAFTRLSRARTMPIDADRPSWSDGHYLRIAGFGIVLIAAVIQAVVIGVAWWGPGMHPFAYKAGMVSLTGWCLAGIGLLLGRYLTPYISFIFPTAVVAVSIWSVVAFLRERGIASWPPSAMTSGNLLIF